MNPAVKIIAACQSVIARFLPPDGIREDFALQELVKILESPEAVAMTMPLPASELGLIEQRAAFEKRQRESAILHGLTASAEDPQVTIARLRDELGRKRQAENDLIRDRDRLIHVDLAELHERVKTLTADRDELLESDKTKSAKIADLQRRLHRAEERVKGVALALAEV